MRIDMTVSDAAGLPCDIAIECGPATRWEQVAGMVHAAAGLAPSSALWAGSCRIGGDHVVGEPPLRPGAVLAADAAPATAARLWQLDTVGGPAAGTVHALDARSSTVGRDPHCDVTLSDPAVSRRHAAFVRSGTGLRVIDQHSVNGTHVNGDRIEVRELVNGDIVRIGDTVLRVTAVGIADRATDPVLASVIDFPADPPRSGARVGRWAGVLVPLLIGMGLAVTMRDLRMLAFAAMSPLILATSLLFPGPAGPPSVRRGDARHRRRAAEHALHEARAAEARLRRAKLPDPVSFRLGIGARTAGSDSAAVVVRVGLGTLASRVREQHGSELRDGTVALVPAPIDVVGAVLNLRLPVRVARGLARWLVLQAVSRQPAPGIELVLAVDDETAGHWSWARWLPDPPTVLTDVTTLRSIAERARGDPVRPDADAVLRRIIVIDSGRRWGRVTDDSSTVIITIGDADARGDVVIEPGASAYEIVIVDRRAEGGRRATAVVDTVTRTWAEDVARLLLATTAAGDAQRRPRSVPRSCRLIELIGPTGELAGAIRSHWETASDVRVPVGRDADGVVFADLAADGPHALVAGTTGSGKSEFLQTWIASLAASVPPEDLAFVLVDFKGGAAFDCLRALPHVCGVLTDLDGAAAQRAVESLHAEMKRRERLFATAGVPGLAAYRARSPTEPVARLVVVVDEFAALADELPDLLRSLVALAQRGRSLGMHLVLATQRPSGAVSSDIRANVTLRIALRASDPADSHEVIGSDAAFRIGAQSPGRAIMRGSGAQIEFQVGAISQIADTKSGPAVHRLGPWRQVAPAAPGPGDERDIDVLVRSIGQAATDTGRECARAPWCPPLPEQLDLAGLADEHDVAVFGLVDRPHLQDQVPLCLDLRTGGSLLVTGGPGSGRTTALRALAAGAGRAATTRLELQAIDCAGGGLARLAGLSTLVDGEADPDGVTCIVQLLADRVRTRRRAAAPGRPRDTDVLICVIDGWRNWSSSRTSTTAGGRQNSCSACSAAAAAPASPWRSPVAAAPSPPLWRARRARTCCCAPPMPPMPARPVCRASAAQRTGRPGARSGRATAPRSSSPGRAISPCAGSGGRCRPRSSP